MSFSLAGRPTLVVALLAFSFLLFLAVAPSHPSLRPSIQPRDLVHPFHRRTVTAISEVTKTVFTTTSTTISASEIAFSTPDSREPSAAQSSSVLPPSSSSSDPSSSPSSSSTSKHRTHHKDTRTSTSPTSTSSTLPETSTLILAPAAPSTTPSTTLVLTDNPFISSSESSPTSAAKGAPTASSFAAPVEATSSGFWSNKGAVAGTFTVVGLIIAGVIVYLLFSYAKRIKQNRNRSYDEELFSSFGEREHSRHGSTPGPESLNHPALDPFAAGEVVQVPGSAASIQGMSGVMAASPSSPGQKTGHGGYGSDDGHASSTGHSSNHHGFSSISYHTGLLESGGNLSRAESPLFYQSLKSAPPPFPSQPHPEDPFSNAAAAPLSANTASTDFTVPSPYLGAGQVSNRQADSDASYYADQIHSYYYGAGATAPPAPRSPGHAY